MYNMTDKRIEFMIDQRVIRNMYKEKGSLLMRKWSTFMPTIYLIWLWFYSFVPVVE